MTSRVLEPTRDDLEERRERLLRRTRMGRDELEAAARAGELSGETFWLWEDIRAIEFLLGADASE